MRKVATAPAVHPLAWRTAKGGLAAVTKAVRRRAARATSAGAEAKAAQGFSGGGAPKHRGRGTRALEIARPLGITTSRNSGRGGATLSPGNH